MFQLLIIMFNCFLWVNIIQISANVDRLHLLVFASLEITVTVVVHMGPVGKLSHHFCHPWWRCKRNDEDVRLDKIYQQDNNGRAQGHRVKQATFLWYSTERMSFRIKDLLDILEGFFITDSIPSCRLWLFLASLFFSVSFCQGWAQVTDPAIKEDSTSLPLRVPLCYVWAAHPSPWQLHQLPVIQSLEGRIWQWCCYPNWGIFQQENYSVYSGLLD